VVVPDDDELPSDDEGDDNDIMPASQPRGPPRDRSKASVAFIGDDSEDDDSVVEEELEVEEIEELIEVELIGVPSRRRTGGAFIQARHAIDATSARRLFPAGPERAHGPRTGRGAQGHPRGGRLGHAE